MRAVIFLLKCVVGFFAAVGFIAVLAAVGLAVLLSRAEPWKTAAEEVPDSAVLLIDLQAGVIETRPDNPLSRASLRHAVALRESLEALEAASRDPRVKGLVAQVGRGRLGLAQVQELRDAVFAFRDQGKFAVAFAQTFGQGGDGTRHYYLASAFEQILLQPSGDLDLTGILLETPFLRGALDELDIEPQVGQREEYKGIANIATDTQLPEPQRRNLQRLVDSWLGQAAEGISQGRNLDVAQVRDLIDRGPYMAEEAREAGLIDRLLYWDEVESEVLERAGEDAEMFELARYELAREAPEADGPVIGLVYGLGPVQLSRSESDPTFGSLVMGSETVAKALADAVADPEVEAIVFRVDSPGGSYLASDVIWREMQLAREAGKPVIVSMGDVAASGGYFVAAPATKIVAQPGTVTGSIGVVAGKLVLSGLWSRLGINWDGVQAGDNAAIWSMNRAFDEAGWERLNTMLDRTYADFTTKVAEGRGLDHEAVLKVAKGQVWSGADAAENGLVDELGGLRRAVALAAEAAGAEPDAGVQLKRFPKVRDPFEAIIEDTLGSSLTNPGLGALVSDLSRLLRALAPLLEAAERLNADPRTQRLITPDLRTAE